MEVKVIYLSDAYDFLTKINKDARTKIIYNITKVRSGISDPTLFKKLRGTDIWEFRTIHAGNCYRMLAFWDTRNDTLIVATHGFIKKSQKTPKNEIDRAELIMKTYFDKNK